MSVMMGGLLLLGASGAAQPLKWQDNLFDGQGAMQQGLACLPSGAFFLEEIAQPDASEILAFVPDAHGELMKISASVCRTYAWVARAPSSRLRLSIMWQDMAGGCRQLIDNKFVMKKADLRRDSNVMLAAVAASYAMWKAMGCVGGAAKAEASAHRLEASGF